MLDPRLVPAAFALIERGRRPFVLGVCGAQGSGKSTLAREICAEAERRGMTAAALSLDDLYLTRAEREDLAARVHPLLRTRGVPGTHDVGLGLAIFDALDRGEAAPLPRFDKACDDRFEAAGTLPHNCELLVFEGWCVGARPQAPAALSTPINALEAREDPGGQWRTFVNDALAGDYQRLFARVDALVMLAAPEFEVVHAWRAQQERELAQHARGEGGGLMDETALARFVQHYERLTRYMLEEMPLRADVLVRLAADRRPIELRTRDDP